MKPVFFSIVLNLTGESDTLADVLHSSTCDSVDPSEGAVRVTLGARSARDHAQLHDALERISRSVAALGRRNILVFYLFDNRYCGVQTLLEVQAAMENVRPGIVMLHHVLLWFLDEGGREEATLAWRAAFRSLFRPADARPDTWTGQVFRSVFLLSDKNSDYMDTSLTRYHAASALLALYTGARLNCDLDGFLTVDYSGLGITSGERSALLRHCVCQSLLDRRLIMDDPKPVEADILPAFGEGVNSREQLRACLRALVLSHLPEPATLSLPVGGNTDTAQYACQLYSDYAGRVDVEAIGARILRAAERRVDLDAFCEYFREGGFDRLLDSIDTGGFRPDLSCADDIRVRKSFQPEAGRLQAQYDALCEAYRKQAETFYLQLLADLRGLREPICGALLTAEGKSHQDAYLRSQLLGREACLRMERAAPGLRQSLESALARIGLGEDGRAEMRAPGEVAFVDLPGGAPCLDAWSALYARVEAFLNARFHLEDGFISVLTQQPNSHVVLNTLKDRLEIGRSAPMLTRWVNPHSPPLARRFLASDKLADKLRPHGGLGNASDDTIYLRDYPQVERLALYAVCKAFDPGDPVFAHASGEAELPDGEGDPNGVCDPAGSPADIGMEYMQDSHGEPSGPASDSGWNMWIEEGQLHGRRTYRLGLTWPLWDSLDAVSLLVMPMGLHTAPQTLPLSKDELSVAGSIDLTKALQGGRYLLTLRRGEAILRTLEVEGPRHIVYVRHRQSGQVRVSVNGSALTLRRHSFSLDERAPQDLLQGAVLLVDGRRTPLPAPEERRDGYLFTAYVPETCPWPQLAPGDAFADKYTLLEH